MFRDKRYKLHLYDLDADRKQTLINYCNYVQWVPQSDVVVAQNRDNLCIWYNIDTPDQMTMIPIKGDVVDLLRQEGKTEVVVHEGNQQSIYTLDERLIEFGTAMEDEDFARAISFLEGLEPGPETDSMWKQLAKVATERRQLQVAQR